MNPATGNSMEKKSMSLSLSLVPSFPHGNAVEAAQLRTSEQQLAPNLNLFKVMRIVPDKQDYGFVEKVQLPEDEILSLCNRLLPGSASASASASAYLGDPRQICIDFDGLNQRYLHAVGFYGDKKMMIHIFRTEGLIDDNSVLVRMEDGSLEPGLYVIVPEDGCCVFVFYWHEGEHFKEASRKDVSCNFIRYLVELCKCVFICLKGSYNFDALAASATRTPSKSIRIHVTTVKNSENDVKILPGFNVRIDGESKTDEFSPAQRAGMAVVNNNNTRVLFCEGYQRCCYLMEEYKAPSSYEMTTTESVKASELGNLLKRLSLESNVDYSRLGSEQFIDVLECCSPLDQYEEYCKLKDSFKTSESALNSAQLNLAKDKFVNESMAKMSGDKKEDLPTLYIEEVAVKRQSLLVLPTPWAAVST